MKRLAGPRWRGVIEKGPGARHTLVRIDPETGVRQIIARGPAKMSKFWLRVDMDGHVLVVGSSDRRHRVVRVEATAEPKLELVAEGQGALETAPTIDRTGVRLYALDANGGLKVSIVSGKREGCHAIDGARIF
jgi:hypothetical protein